MNHQLYICSDNFLNSFNGTSLTTLESILLVVKHRCIYQIVSLSTLFFTDKDNIGYPSSILASHIVKEYEYRYILLLFQRICILDNLDIHHSFPPLVPKWSAGSARRSQQQSGILVWVHVQLWEISTSVVMMSTSIDRTCVDCEGW